jgi:uncharacterized membrane protein YheB (UPF0754 family)
LESLRSVSVVPTVAENVAVSQLLTVDGRTCTKLLHSGRTKDNGQLTKDKGIKNSQIFFIQDVIKTETYPLKSITITLMTMMKMGEQARFPRRMYGCLFVLSFIFSTGSGFSLRPLPVTGRYTTTTTTTTTRQTTKNSLPPLAFRFRSTAQQQCSSSGRSSCLGLTTKTQSHQLSSSHAHHHHNLERRRRHAHATETTIRTTRARSTGTSTLLTLTTTAGDESLDEDDDSDSTKKPSAIQRAVAKFKARPGTYLLIPCVAAVVGWFTNWLAVQMIFYPINFRGIPLFIRPEVPFGFLGWQGIIPCKTRPMSEAMVLMVSTQLLTVKEAFARLDPKIIAKLLAPEVPDLTVGLLEDVLPTRMSKLVGRFFSNTNSPNSLAQKILLRKNTQFLTQLTRGIQENIDSVFSLRNCVVDQMMLDRTMLGQLFRKCGQAELDFLTNSGLWFGFLLGLIQLVVALFWDNPWTLSIGGGIVGLATNWLALKWIFEPVDPWQVGPFLLQGKFLRRQTEVANEFSKFFSQNILTSEQLWKSVLNDPTTRPAFTALFAQRFGSFVQGMTGPFFRVKLVPEVVTQATNKALAKLPQHLPVIFPYMDSTLALQDTLRVRMEAMTSRQFERVLHPIFEQDELTLILAGAFLGFAAGLVQQGLETGQIKIPDIWTPLSTAVVNFYRAPRQQLRLYSVQLKSRIRAKNPFSRGAPSDESAETNDDDDETNDDDDKNEEPV